MHRTFHVLFFLFAIFLIQGCKVYTACNHIIHSHKQVGGTVDKGEARLEYYGEIPVVHLYGTPVEMGEQYGALMKDQLNSVYTMVDVLFSPGTIKKYKAQGRKSIDKVPTDIKEYIKGMAAISGVSEENILILNLIPRVTCSVLAVWDSATIDGNLLMGRNADYVFKKINKALGLIVVKHPDTGLATVTSTFVGMVGGFTGMNEKGVCYGNMLVYNGISDEVNISGLPIQMLMQTGGEKAETAREMIDYLMQQQHMVPGNVMCADCNEAIIAELSQTRNVIREGSKGVLAASNFFYSSGMFSHTETDRRFSDLMLMAKENYGNFNLNILQKAMHKARKPNQNLQCVLFEPVRMKMHVSMNKVPASEGPFTELDITELLSN